MTRSLIVSAAVLLMVGCGSTQQVEHSEGEDLGPISSATLLGSNYPEFREVFDRAVIGPEFIALISQVSEGADFLVFLGTWCGDSRREVPRFLRIVQEAGIDEDHVQLYNLDHSKKSPDGLTERWAIERVPTFIVLRHGREVGRIVERPRSTLEGDLLSILALDG
jgi:thiol-disulfide isomerase/thioredoxin